MGSVSRRISALLLACGPHSHVICADNPLPALQKLRDVALLCNRRYSVFSKISKTTQEAVEK